MTTALATPVRTMVCVLMASMTTLVSVNQASVDMTAKLVSNCIMVEALVCIPHKQVHHHQYNSMICMLIRIICLASDVNECDSTPCLNGGQCGDEIGDFVCYCPALYAGKTCDVCKYYGIKHQYYNLLNFTSLYFSYILMN